MNNFNSQKGFSLIEVLISLTLFGVFIITFYSSQGNNTLDSELMEEDLKLAELAHNIMEETILNTPPVSLGAADFKNFEENYNQKYQYSVEVKKLELPELGKLMGNPNNNGNEDVMQKDEQSGMEKMVLNKLQQNMEKLIVQIRIIVRNKETKYSYGLSSWVRDYKKNVDLDLNR